MRGKRLVLFAIGMALRITPADAGKTYRQGPRLRGYEDHPRGCGENASGSRAAAVPSGSPPRMRGKLIDEVQDRFQDRITPADAGKTFRC